MIEVLYNIIINEYILAFIYIHKHGSLSATIGFMSSLYDNHQEEKVFFFT